MHSISKCPSALRSLLQVLWVGGYRLALTRSLNCWRLWDLDLTDGSLAELPSLAGRYAVWFVARHPGARILADYSFQPVSYWVRSHELRRLERRAGSLVPTPATPAILKVLASSGLAFLVFGVHPFLLVFCPLLPRGGAQILQIISIIWLLANTSISILCEFGLAKRRGSRG